MRKAKVNINNEELQVASELLRALSHPLRLQILDYIDKSKQVNVNKIYNALKLEQSITSQHLRILRLTGLVTTERDGKMIYYTIDYDRMAQVVKALNGFLESNNKLDEV